MNLRDQIRANTNLRENLKEKNHTERGGSTIV